MPDVFKQWLAHQISKEKQDVAYLSQQSAYSNKHQHMGRLGALEDALKFYELLNPEPSTTNDGESKGD